MYLKTDDVTGSVKRPTVRVRWQFSDTPQGQIILTLSSDRKNSASAPGPTCEPVTGS